VQNYITAIILFLIVEMLVTWGFYDFMNRMEVQSVRKAYDPWLQS